jgi:hypothetical protein
VTAEPRRAAERCTNCGAAATGVYCARCGQRIEPHIHTVWGFLREATESLTHADSRLWRTLSTLLVRPGQLTREFLDGRRASYLPPFRLYLVVSVLFFLVASALGGMEPGAREDLAKEAAKLAASTDAEERAAGEKLLKALQTGEPQKCESFSYSGPWEEYLKPRLQHGCDRILAGEGREIVREFMANVPRALFLFLPLIAFVMMLMYWFPRRLYVEHLLFFVHNHSFAFLFFMLMILVAAPLPEWARGWVSFAAFAYTFWYLFRSMRVMYGQGRALTLVKYLTLGIVYFVLGTVLTLLTAAYAFVTV